MRSFARWRTSKKLARPATGGHSDWENNVEDELIPLGWKHDPSEGFIALIGGIWSSGTGKYGFISRSEHGNRNGVVHGGMMMSFADRILGMSARAASGAIRGATISFSCQFMAPLKLGRFAMMEPRVERLTKSMAFMTGSLVCDDEVILSAQGVWRISTSATNPKVDA